MTLPRSAVWLMSRFGVLEALVGDLAEQTGQSAYWVWWQTFGAIVTAVARDWSSHWILTCRGILLGQVLLGLHRTFQSWLWDQVNMPFAQVMFAIGVRHLPFPGAAANTLLAVPGWFCVGLLIARLHPTRTPAAVLAFLLATWCLASPAYARQATNALGDPRFRPYLAVNVIGICAFSVSVLAGGLYGRRRIDGLDASPIGPG
jgi:hypothetical protein